MDQGRLKIHYLNFLHLVVCLKLQPLHTTTTSRQIQKQMPFCIIFNLKLPLQKRPKCTPFKYIRWIVVHSATVNNNATHCTEIQPHVATDAQAGQRNMNVKLIHLYHTPACSYVRDAATTLATGRCSEIFQRQQWMDAFNFCYYLDIE